MEDHVSHNLTDALWLSADAYYNVGGETSIDGISQDNMANTLRLGAGMGLRIWRGADFVLNYERVVAKPSGEPDARTVRFTIRPAVVKLGDRRSFVARLSADRKTSARPPK